MYTIQIEESRCYQSNYNLKKQDILYTECKKCILKMVSNAVI